MKIALIELGLIAACMLLAYFGMRRLLRKPEPDDATKHDVQKED